MRNIVYIFILSVILLCTTNISADSLDYDLYNSSDDTPASGIEFPGIDTLGMDNLWIVSPQYVRVTYSSTASRWAIRIITKNDEDIGGVAPRIIGTNDPGPDGVLGTDDDGWGLGADGIPGTGDDRLIVTFGGLINPSTKNDPNSRASLAWQVFRYNDPYYEGSFLDERIRPTAGNNPSDPNDDPNDLPSPPPTLLTDIDEDGDGVNITYTSPGGVSTTINYVGGGPIDDWAYIADVSDTGYVAAPGHDYFWIAYGSGATNFLAQHPVVYWRDRNGDGVPDFDRYGRPIALPKPGGGDCIVYLGARFGLRHPSGTSDIGVLPTGDYGTTLYLELITW